MLFLCITAFLWDYSLTNTGIQNMSLKDSACCIEICILGLKEILIRLKTNLEKWLIEPITNSLCTHMIIWGCLWLPRAFQACIPWLYVDSKIALILEPGWTHVFIHKSQNERKNDFNWNKIIGYDLNKCYWCRNSNFATIKNVGFTAKYK